MREIYIYRENSLYRVVGTDGRARWYSSAIAADYAAVEEVSRHGDVRVIYKDERQA